MDFAAASTALQQGGVQSQVAIKALKLANDQQKSALSLIEGATQSAEQIQAGARESGRGEVIDVQA